MARLIRSAAALADLDAAWDYVAADNLAAADAMIADIGHKCALLAIHPELGELRPELADRLRSFVVGNYVIFYRAIADGIEIVRVLHAARDVDTFF